MTTASDRDSESPGKTRTRSLRFRVIAGFVLLLTVATVASVLLIRQVLHLRIDERIDGELVQESRELRALASGNDPETGRPFGDDVRRVFEIFLERNIPSQNQTFVTYLNGEPFLRSRRPTRYRLDQDPAFTALWNDINRTERGNVETPEGTVEYLAIPLQTKGESRGVFVDAWFSDHERGAATPAIVGASALGGLVLLVGTLLAWRVTNQVLRPINEITRTARAISETDLTRRIEERGDDEVALLASTFNSMLDRLEEAFGTQREFLDDVSHELRTPITVVQGHLDLLEDEPAERDKTLALVHDELDRMARLVNDLLLLTRSGRPDFLTLETMDVTTFTHEVHSKSQTLGPHAWSVGRVGNGRIVADRQRLTQAMMQLAANAAKHTPRGKSIELGSSVADGTASFWVRDSGPGVPKEEREQIFKRFGRGRGSQRSEGAGLGLAIVAAIAEAHDGSVQLHSEPGRGAEFTIRVPTEGPRAHEVIEA